MGGKSISLHREECGLGCAEDVCIHERCSRCTTTGCSLCSTKLIIRSGSTLVVNGTMIISGQLDGGGAAQDYTGATTGYYAELKLESGAKIEVNGTLHVPGFITESSNGESIVKINTDGTIYQPFVVRDFKGGTVTGAIYNSIKNLGIPYSPFNEFCTMNVYAPMHIYGSVISYANIYADDKQNATVAPLVGLTSSSFIQLSDGAYIVADYDLETEILKMDFYGGATTNSFSVSVNAPMIGLMTMTSQQFIFPISWMYDITLHNGSYNMTKGNRFKLLPGSKFTVESDASLEISYLQVYESFIQDAQVKSYRARYQNTPAIFTVNGTVNVEELGGKVYATAGSASLTITKSVSLSSVEPLTYPDKEAVVAGAAGGLLGGFLGDTGCVSTNMTINSPTKLLYKYYENGEWKVKDFSSSIILNMEYISDSNNKTWKPNGTTVEFVIQPGTSVTMSDGTTYTATTATGPIKVSTIEGLGVTFHLSKNYILVTNGSTSVQVSPGDIKAGDYDKEWIAKSGENPIIYWVPALTITEYSTVDTCTITYVLDQSNLTGYINVYAKKEGWSISKKTATVTIADSATNAQLAYHSSGSGRGTRTAEVTLKVTADCSIKVSGTYG